MSSLLDKLNAAATQEAAPAAQVVAQAATSAAPVAEAEVVTFVISEAEIKANPAYQIATDTSKTEETRIKDLIALKAYNQKLTAEENATNLAAFNAFLLYSENQILTVTQKSIEFTNDEAFSLFDSTIQTLQTNLGIFKGHLQPLVNAFGVIQKARAKGIAPHALLQEVQEMKNARKALADELAVKQKELAEAIAKRDPIQNDAKGSNQSLVDLTKKIDAAKIAKATAEGIKTAEEQKYPWSRDKAALTAAIAAISTAGRDIVQYQDAIATLARTSQVTADGLDRQNESVTKIEAEIQALDARLKEMDAQLVKNDDTVALSKLLEITGPEFKGQREQLTESVKTLVSSSVGDFERSMGRFESGGKEVGVMKDTVMNVGGLVGLVAKADAKVRVMDADFIAQQEATVKRIREEKGEEAIFDLEYEKASEQYKNASNHAKEGLALANRTGELSIKLTSQEGTYRGLEDAFRQKFLDAQRLRTNAAVDVSSKLLTTTKMLEMAIAGEKTAAVDDMLADLSSSASQATTDIFNMLSQSKGAENDRMAEALKQAIDTTLAMDSVMKDLRTKAREGIETQEALRQVRGQLGTLNEGLAAMPADVEREAQAEGLQALGEKRALDVATAAAAAAKPKSPAGGPG